MYYISSVSIFMTMILEVPHFGGGYALPYKEVIDKITVYTLSVIYLSVGIFSSKKLLLD